MKSRDPYFITSHEQVMSKSRTSLEQVINKLPTSNEQVMNKSQTSHEQCKDKWVWKDTNIDLVILYPHQPHFKVIILKSFLSLMFSWSFSKKPWHFFKCLVAVYRVIFLSIYTSALFLSISAKWYRSSLHVFVLFLGPQGLYERCCAWVSAWVSAWVVNFWNQKRSIIT